MPAWGWCCVLVFGFLTPFCYFLQGKEVTRGNRHIFCMASVGKHSVFESTQRHIHADDWVRVKVDVGIAATRIYEQPFLVLAIYRVPVFSVPFRPPPEKKEDDSSSLLSVLLVYVADSWRDGIQGKSAISLVSRLLCNASSREQVHHPC